MKWARTVLALGALAFACSSDDASADKCADVSGIWTLTGDCQDNSCTISQNVCSVSLDCSPTGTVYSGTVSGNLLSFGDGSGTCSGTVATKAANGSCDIPGFGKCDWAAQCQSGGCAVAGSGGNTGSGGTGGACSTHCAALTSCCSQITKASCLADCASTPPSAGCQSCFSNTSCGSSVPCITSQCGVASELCK